MSHHIYTTEAFVIESFPSSESGKFIKLFTRELGMVGAQAQGVKNLKSKLRFGLEDYSLSLVSFVRGKGGWRITGAMPVKNFFHSFKNQKEKLIICAESLNLIKCLVVGEEKNQELFSLLKSAFNFLEKEELSSKNLADFECLLVLRIVSNLGYLAYTKKTENFVSNTVWDHNTLKRVSLIRKEAIGLINQSFVESGLR